MKRISFVLLTILLSGCGSSIPSRYDHAYKGTLYLAYTDGLKVRQVCGSPRALGCSVHLSKDKCLVVINQNYKTNKNLFNHEQAHCNGWTGKHEP